MIMRLKEEDLEVVVRISGKLGEGWSFKISNWLGGVQCDWVRGRVSIMWRSVVWDRETVERHVLVGSEEEKRYNVDYLLIGGLKISV